MSRVIIGARGAYPRWRGGNEIWQERVAIVRGLSPLARGKLLSVVFGEATRGPIPAGAGETPGSFVRLAPRRAYPRWRGGNSRAAGMPL